MSMDIDLVIENDAPTTVAPTLASKRISNNSCSLDGSLRGQSKRILGTETTIHDSFKRRILWAQRGIYFFKVLGLFSYILAQIVDGSDVRAILLTSSLTFGGMALLCFGCLYYKNISFVMIRRLSKETNVIIIIILISCNLAIEIARPDNSFSSPLAFVYMLLVYAYVSSDAMICKSRYFIVGIGMISVALSIYNLYGTTLGDWNIGVVLLNYKVGNNSYVIMKRATKRSIHLQILLFSMNSVYTLLTDKAMELMIFATGNVYKANIFSLKRTNVEEKSRFKYTQFGISLFCFLSLVLYIVDNTRGDHVMMVPTTAFGGMALLGFGCLFHKNVSLDMLKRVLKEPNVIFIVVLTVSNVIIEIASPVDWRSQMMAWLYMLLTNAYVFSDVVVCKHRYFVIYISMMSVAINIYNFYGNTFGNWNSGVVLLAYSIQGKQYTIMRRSTKRAIYLEILLFSINGVYTTFVDIRMELMMFATSNIYRSSGTSSQDVCTSFATKLKSEMADKSKSHAIL